MVDQVRYNEGKTKLSYWMGTQASTFVYSGDVYEEHDVLKAINIERALGEFLRGEDTYVHVLDVAMECFTDRDTFAEAFCRACMYGEEKYWRGGFTTGAPVSQYVDSASRHLKALRTGSAEYEESFTKDGVTHTRQLNHWWSVAWNVVMIFEVMESCPEVRDDRLFHKGDYSGTPLELPATKSVSRDDSSTRMSDEQVAAASAEIDRTLREDMRSYCAICGGPCKKLRDL